MLRSLIVLGALGWFAACGVAVDAEELQTDCASDTEFCCPAGSKLCDSECVSRRNPKYGCDADACVPCLVDNATATCGANGSCRVAVCDPGFADCNEFDIDGCEVDLTSDPDNCRRCGVECDFPNGRGQCNDSRCELLQCDVGWLDCRLGEITTRVQLGNGLGSDYMSTGEDCETPQYSEQHCGTCANSCDDDEICDYDGADAQGRLLFSCH
jgi:hypothetical protein